MYTQKMIWRWIAGGLAVAAVVGFAAAQGADAGPFRSLLPSRVVSARSDHRGQLDVSSRRVAKQILMVTSGKMRVSQLGRTALRIYEAGGISTAAPDAQAVGQARSGSLLTGRDGRTGPDSASCAQPAKNRRHASTCDQRAPSRVSFCAPTATVCNTSLPTAAVSFCAPTATVCNTSLPTAADTTAQTSAREKRVAASVTTSQANAMQAAAVARGEANSVLSNPYIEQKVTTAESVGGNRTKIPAGGF